MNGILNILKPPHMTSHDVVNFIRKTCHIKKVGHTGTLDPMAAGVLPICIGQATKISQYLLNDQKKYRCEMTLGYNTDTQDRWGKVTATRPVQVSKSDIIEAFNAFKGEIYQKPPMYSALKHKGKKLYELARQGIEIERKPRKVYIYDCDIIEWHENIILFDVLCSKGTYVRTLCEDIGNKLGCGAYMSFLLRTQSGAFRLEKAITLEKIEALSIDQIEKDYLFPMDYPITYMPKVTIEERYKNYVLNGQDIYLTHMKQHDELILNSMVRIYLNDQFIAFGKVKKNQEFYIDINRVFN